MKLTRGRCPGGGANLFEVRQAATAYVEEFGQSDFYEGEVPRGFENGHP